MTDAAAGRASDDAMPGHTLTLAGEAAASETLDRWYAAWNAHDGGAVLALMTDDVRYEDPMAPEPVMHGREQIRPYANAAFHAAPDLHIEMLDKWVTRGGQVIASAFEFTATFTAALRHPGRLELAPTGRSLRISGMDRSEIRDDYIARHQLFWDGAEFGRQMGLLPPRDSTSERLGVRLQHLTARRMRKRA